MYVDIIIFLIYNSAMDYYKILEVNENASLDEIKKSYRKLAGKHHPDKGGDTKRFQEISQAYDTLSDPDKKAMYDAEKNGQGFNPFTAQGGGGQGWFDVGSMFGQGFGRGHPFEEIFRQGQRRAKNRDLNINIKIAFDKSYTGTELEANYKLPSGKNQTVLIKVPPGIQSGQTIRYHGMGDDSIGNLPRGDLLVTVVVEPTQLYERFGDHLIAYIAINPFEAMLGCTKMVEIPGGKNVRFNLPPGVDPSSDFASAGLGFKNINSNFRGDLIIKIKMQIPAVTDQELKEKLEKLYAEISLTSK